MNLFDQKQRRLLVEVSLAAANHRLAAETERFLPVLNELVADPQDRACVRAVLLCSLERRDEARACLDEMGSDAAAMLCEIIDAGSTRPPVCADHLTSGGRHV